MRDVKNEQVLEDYVDLSTYDWESAFSEANHAINHAKPFDQWAVLPSRVERGMVLEAYYVAEGENDGDPWLLVGKALCPTKKNRAVRESEGYYTMETGGLKTWNPPKIRREDYEDFDHPREFYFALSAWCDYTGWDCQAGGRFQVGETLREVLVYGLADNEREQLGISLTDIDNLPPLVKLG
jgi:hypothetical protein